VIFVTVGTHHQRFERLLCALGPLAELDELVVQYGDASPPAVADRAVPFLSYAEVVSYMERARAVVTHAGVGSFLVARRAGQVPVMVPRLRACGEHVDDHQIAFVRALEREGLVRVVWDVADLKAAVLAEPPRLRAVTAEPVELRAAVRHAIDGDAPAPTLVPASESIAIAAGRFTRPLGGVASRKPSPSPASRQPALGKARGRRRVA
jgi:UDP-N-acetylglucosamine transferase subunit ALG13